ncbi:MAG: hypothetical protein IT555_12515 [Acetobacteraceae bacterium]|nr:hypothetical protein [Acetobacteraceae bacterium]
MPRRSRTLRDRLRVPYRAQPEASHGGIAIATARFRNPGEPHLDHMLARPLRDHPPLEPPQ